MVSAAILAATALPAQEGPLSLEFSFSNPGARSMGFGGAFVALADDATAAFANPAGLVQLTRQEVSIEGRRWSWSTPFTAGGRLAGEPTGIGLDTVAGLRRAETSADLDGLSFVSWVLPKNRWAVAVYRHQLARFESLSETQGFFADRPARFPDFRRRTDFDVVSHSVALARRVGERLSLGLTVSQFSSDADLLTQTFAPVPGPTLPEGPFGRNAYHPSALAFSNATTSDATALGFGLGGLWRLSERWSLGGSYRQGPRLGFRNRESGGPAGPSFDELQKGDIRLPHVVALGVAFRSPDGRLTVAGEWDRVEYSALVDSLGDDAQEARLDDGHELRLGAELVFAGVTPVVALRAGVWVDPDHRIRFTGTDEPLDLAIFRPGTDEVHFALGVGVAFERFQIDAAVDLSDLVDTVSLSAIYGF